MRSIYSTLPVLLCALASQGHAADDLQARIEAMRADVTKQMGAGRIMDADIVLSIPLAPVSDALTVLNNAPAPRRTVTLQSTGANGYFWKDDPNWCGSFAELGSPNGLQGAVELSKFRLDVPNSNSLGFSVDAAVTLSRADVHWHFKGPRCPGSDRFETG